MTAGLLSRSDEKHSEKQTGNDACTTARKPRHLTDKNVLYCVVKVHMGKCK